MSDPRSFFDGYAAASMRADAQAIAARYAGAFLVSGPEGSATFENDERFLVWLGSVFDRNRELGMTSLRVSSLHSEPVGEHHLFATVEWVTTFEKTGSEAIRFEISYLLKRADAGLLILAYVTHEDEQALMKAKGLIAARRPSPTEETA